LFLDIISSLPVLAGIPMDRYVFGHDDTMTSTLEVQHSLT
jgi:hypothetical protein